MYAEYENAITVPVVFIVIEPIVVHTPIQKL